MVEQDLAGLTSRVSTAMIVISVVAVALRFVARKWAKVSFGWDDWFALASLPFTVAISSSFYFAINHGYATPTGDTQYYYRIIYVNELLWFTSFLLTKFSVLFFYHRVFGTKDGLKITLYVIGAITLVWWFVIFFVAVFQCHPVTGSIAAPGSKCIKPLPFFYAQTIPNIITDFAILFTPMPILAQLKLKFTKKLGLCLIFAVGYFVPIISIVRIVYFVKLAHIKGKHSAYDTALSTIWSILETAFALVGACIPTLTIIVRRSFDLVSRTYSSVRSISGSSAKKSGGFQDISDKDEHKHNISGQSVELLNRERSLTSSQEMPQKPESTYNPGVQSFHNV
ncbi:hypothetical protein HYFRA_00002989 [Hymenoscyphus fraxineus]|uniref:Rhodopsin domain-containing protein n=1 Tax=Hymenoscyphus fraxineus TaxID=746836 RepID=A0A9N9KRG0_9HELO|nr:hypothetical protein HYFRA_00002989 [Hymenoscyphus fraxineus]